MSTVVLHVTMSLDGFMAGPNVSVDQPMGEGGLRLHEWVFNTATSPIDAAVAHALRSTVGAVVLGRRTFDVGIGVWGDTPFPAPCYVVTHRADDPLRMQSGTFTFAVDGIDAAIRDARGAAGDRDVVIMGADIAQQALRYGHIDELHLQIAPVLLGSGRRLFEGTGPTPIEFERLSTQDSPYVTHLKYRVRHER